MTQTQYFANNKVEAMIVAESDRPTAEINNAFFVFST
jgi:hypothetical protein